MNYSTGTVTITSNRRMKPSERRHYDLLILRERYRDTATSAVIVALYAGLFMFALYKVAGPPC